jgi:hypothetical protein
LIIEEIELKSFSTTDKFMQYTCSFELSIKLFFHYSTQTCQKCETEIGTLSSLPHLTQLVVENVFLASENSSWIWYHHIYLNGTVSSPMK